MNNETLKNQARSLFLILDAKQNQSAIIDPIRFNRLYPIVQQAYRRYRRRIKSHINYELGAHS
jgi:hypothetical protein